MNEEAVLKLIAESPDALKAFEMWMRLQWAEFGVLCSFVAIILFAVGLALYMAATS